MMGHTDIVKFLTVEKHCDPMCRDSKQDSPLHKAARNGHIDVVKFLLRSWYRCHTAMAQILAIPAAFCGTSMIQRQFCHTTW